MKFNLNEKIYYHGDMSNPSGWFAISERKESMFGKMYELTEINADEVTRVLKVIPEHTIKNEYAGNGSTRFVTEEAYNEYKQQMSDRFKGLGV